MHTSDAFPAKFLKAEDLQGRSTTVVIDRYTMEKFPDGQSKPALYFRGKIRGMILNRTNANAIEYDCGYGGNMDDWIGKSITLFSAMVDFQGKRVPALRVQPAVEKVTAYVPKAAPVPVTRQRDEGLEDEIPF